ncbi:hypothetical protein [Shimazuella kribbensis]|uniref:hypothetical protein n=1 Tax=Shimazuella kribbensis TaxID=139808 RepID=UPI000565788F|nr:hypothetical protein [Shimazuella kribbensis]
MSSLITDFIQFLLQDPYLPAKSLQLRTFAGKTFLYANPIIPVDVMLNYIQSKGKHFLRGTIWSLQCQYTRKDATSTVYQIAFLAPEEKSFCCGNQCINCKWRKR